MIKYYYLNQGLRKGKAMNTELSRNIDAARERAAYDAACKSLLSNKIILAWILKECVSEYKGYSAEDIAEKYIEGTPEISSSAVHPGGEKITGLNTIDSSVNEGEIAYDILFSSLIPETDDKLFMIINVEAQKKYNPGYPLIKRAIYYCSRLISSQYQKYFTSPHYDNIRKVYSIWVCPYPPVDKEDTITAYSIREINLVGDAKEAVADYDLMSAVMVCLGTHNSNDHKGLLELLEVLLSSSRSAAEKKSILENSFSIAMTREMEGEVTEMCNLSDVLEERALERGKAEGREEGKAEGREEGKAEGREEGIMIGVTNNIKQLMSNLKLTANQAMNALGIPPQEQPKYLEMIGQK